MMRLVVIPPLLVSLAAVAEPPFVAAYVHLAHVVDRDGSDAENREAIAASVASAKRAGMTVLIAHTSNSSGIAYYPSSAHPEPMFRRSILLFPSFGQQPLLVVQRLQERQQVEQFRVGQVGVETFRHD